MLDANLRVQLIRQARELAEERGWKLLDPIEVTASAEAGDPVWMIHSNYLSLGRNVLIVLRKSDLGLVRAAYLPR